jgi:hypothetical protein
LKPFLLDVNVLVALLWPAHVHHQAAKRWFGDYRKAGFRSCPITQAGSIRILSSPRYSREMVTVGKAQVALSALLALPDHEFWPDDIPVSEAISNAGLIAGHQQITDAYLVALAKAHGGMVATFDRGVLALEGAKNYVELILS